ncbi:hypothetical protein CRUP_032367, partial [Coryphaenoides rupestris]
MIVMHLGGLMHKDLCSEIVLPLAVTLQRCIARDHKAGLFVVIGNLNLGAIVVSVQNVGHTEKRSANSERRCWTVAGQDSPRCHRATTLCILCERPCQGVIPAPISMKAAVISSGGEAMMQPSRERRLPTVYRRHLSMSPSADSRMSLTMTLWPLSVTMEPDYLWQDVVGVAGVQ